MTRTWPFGILTAVCDVEREARENTCAEPTKKAFASHDYLRGNCSASQSVQQ